MIWYVSEEVRNQPANHLRGPDLQSALNSEKDSVDSCDYRDQLVLYLVLKTSFARYDLANVRLNRATAVNAFEGLSRTSGSRLRVTPR